jgi:GNAT superfamily N-acetyltransferase
MTIDAGLEKDIPEVLSLYRLVLGDAEGIRSEAFWRWKHLQNPFGPSPLLLAREGEKIIGMRAFLRWRFCYEGKPFLAYRAVDTATHPEHRGKGIFSKLTLAMIDQLKDGEPSLIFNTPNAHSKAGYLKMGWKEFGNTKLIVRINPLNMIANLLRVRHDASSNAWDEEALNAVLPEWVKRYSAFVNTDYSMDYLTWRYQSMPTFSYCTKVIRGSGGIVVIIYRIKKYRSLVELRINEIFHAGSSVKGLIKTAVNELNDSLRPDVITLLADAQGFLHAELPYGFFKAHSKGLTITYRKVNAESLEDLAKRKDKWNLSAGTVELF